MYYILLTKEYQLTIKILLVKVSGVRITFLFFAKEVAFFADFGIMNVWQHFGNRKLVSQNNMYK